MGHPTIRTDILKVLTDRPGMVVYVDEIVEQTGFTKKQIQAVIGSLLKSNVQGLSIAVHGNAWTYSPVNGNVWVDNPTAPVGPPVKTTPRKKKVEPRIFEEVGHTKSGELMIRDQNMTLYFAKEME